MYNDIRSYLEWKSTYTQKAPLNYRLHLARLAEYCKKPTDQIQIDDVIGFLNDHKDKYSMAHTAYVATIIKNYFEFIRRQGRPCLDPYLIRPPKFTPHSHTPLTLEDFEAIDKLLSEYDFHELTQKVSVHLLWDTGMRVSELCELKVTDIDEKKMAAQIITKKNKKYRWVFWTIETNRLLSLYVRLRIQYNSKPDLIIPQKAHGGKVTPRTIQRWVKALAKKAHINKKISPHSFRHGKAHRMLEINPSCVKDIQVLLGHSETNPQASFSYLRLSRNEVEKRAKMYLR